MTYENIAYFLLETLSVKTTSNFMGVFYNKSGVNKNREIIFYFIFFIFGLISTIGKTPVIFNISSSLILSFLISYNYKNDIKKSILVTVYVYLIGAFIEFFLFVALINENISLTGKNEVINLGTVAISYTLNYLVSIILPKKNEDDIKLNIPRPYFINIISTPMLILIILIIAIALYSSDQKVGFLIILLILIIIILSNYLLLRDIFKLISENAEKSIIDSQNQYLKNQLNLIEESNKHNSMLRHDMKNHLLSLKLLSENEDDRAGKYIDDVLQKMENKQIFANTGNVIIDSIVNYKLGQLSREHIVISADISADENITISDFDLTTMLSNLLDNAIRAARESKDNKKIELKINYERNRLYISCINSYFEIKKDSMGNYLTTKEDSNNHGIGIKSIRDTVEKYDGIMDIDSDGVEFKTEIIIYC